MIQGYGKNTELLHAVNYSRFLPGTREQKLQWLEGRGFCMSMSKYDKIVNFLKYQTKNRLDYIANTEFADEFLQQIDRAKETIAESYAKMRNPRISDTAYAKVSMACLEWEKHLTKLYDADAVVAHIMEKINAIKLVDI